MRTAGAADLRAQLGDYVHLRRGLTGGVGDKHLYRLRDNGEIVALGGVYRWSTARLQIPT